jgi:hypothetical protein
MGPQGILWVGTPQKYYLNSAYIFPDCIVKAVSRHHEELHLLKQFPIMSSTEWERSVQASDYWTFGWVAKVHK